MTADYQLRSLQRAAFEDAMSETQVDGPYDIMDRVLNRLAGVFDSFAKRLASRSEVVLTNATVRISMRHRKMEPIGVSTGDVIPVTPPLVDLILVEVAGTTIGKGRVRLVFPVESWQWMAIDDEVLP
jgi:hypothetical protein